MTGEGADQDNISGEGQEEPRAEIDAELRLDLGAETIARRRTRLQFSNAKMRTTRCHRQCRHQSGVHSYRLGAGRARPRSHSRLARRGFRAPHLWRFRARQWNDALARGSRPQSRDATGRIGYELSPALIPFLEPPSANRSMICVGIRSAYAAFPIRAMRRAHGGRSRRKTNGELALVTRPSASTMNGSATSTGSRSRPVTGHRTAPDVFSAC
ncbi:hypothetical protein F2981_03215 [Sinorhizobium meliloti]|nr:hypothetical protein [Sinorhizobium meliloti]